jgi:glutamate racemase
LRELYKINPKIKIYQKACPLLVPIVEAGEHENEITDIMLKKYLKPLLDKKVDTLILGCTHYGILEPKIKKIVGKNVNIVSESKIVAKKLKDYLMRHPEIEKKLAQNGKQTFYSTDITDNFQVLGSKFFGKKIKVEKANL